MKAGMVNDIASMPMPWQIVIASMYTMMLTKTMAMKENFSDAIALVPRLFAFICKGAWNGSSAGSTTTFSSAGDGLCEPLPIMW